MDIYSSSKTLRILCLVSVFLFLGIPWQIAIAKEKPNAPGLNKAPGLFTSQDVPRGSRKAQKARKMMNRSAFRQRSVQVKMDLLKHKKILLNLFADAEFTAERIHMKKGPEGEYTWTGKLMGPVSGMAHITVFGDSVAGSVTTDSGQLFEVSSGPDGQIMIEEVDVEQLPPHIDPVVPPAGAPFEEGALEDFSTQNSANTSADSGSTIDVIVFYTQASRVRYGESGIQTRIINAVDAMNTANADSLVRARYRLVYMGEVDYVETGDMGDALGRIRQKTDGFMDGVHALRDQYGADVVSLIVEDNNYCGIAYQMGSGSLNNNGFAAWAFNVTGSGCLSNYTLAHEIGHNEGCAHDRNNASSGSRAYSFGYQHPDRTFRTIMAYGCPGGFCPRIPNFSNPNVNHNGEPTGIDHSVDPGNSTDNARTKNENESTIANWRQAVEVTVPQTPGNLNLVAVSSDRIDVSWVDNADNEEGFNLERSLNGSNGWSVIATLSANTTSYSDNGLSGNTTYFYRVQAYNGVGNSTYSNTGSATTPASGNVSPTAAFTSSASSLMASFTDTSTDSDGTIASRSWNFGDGATSTSQNPTHTYASSGVYTVRLTVTDNDGATDTFSRSVTVTGNTNQAPTAGFISTASNLTVSFRDDSVDNDGTIASRSWNFGDGATSTSQNPTHTYASSGVYTVRLTVTDNDGASNTLNRIITVTAANKAPTAGFSYSTSGLTINFTDASTDSDGTIASRSWNFGDGRVSTLANPSHTFASSGSYTVRLTVTDDDGASKSSSKRIVVLNPNQSKRVLYMYCFLYGCNSNELNTAIEPVNPGTPSARNNLSPSSSANADNKGSSQLGATTGTSKAPVSSGSSSANTRRTTVASAPQSLAAPSDLTVSVLTSRRSKTKTATLKWADNSGNELEFVIERCEQKGKGTTCKFVEWDTVPANTTRYKDAPVRGIYKYRVKARNKSKDSAKSKEVKI